MGPRRCQGRSPIRPGRRRGQLRGRSPPKRGEAGSRCRGSGHQSQEPERESAQPAPFVKTPRIGPRAARANWCRLDLRRCPESMTRCSSARQSGTRMQTRIPPFSSFSCTSNPTEPLGFVPPYRARPPSGGHGPGNPFSVERRTPPTGLREPGSREPESREPGPREPESREPESREPASRESGSPASS